MTLPLAVTVSPSKSGSDSYPKWLSDCKHDLTNSKEWGELRGELQAAVEQQLTESHVDQFTALSDAERKMFLERALQAVQGGEQSALFQAKLLRSVDKHISWQVCNQLIDKSGIPMAATKSDLILDQANEASMTLLTRWPELKPKLHRCFNRILPSGLRQVAWKLYLSNPPVRAQYLSSLERDPESTMSLLDLEIVGRCDALLQSEPTFRPLAFKPDVLHAMKAVLSYHHACKQTKTPLLDTDYSLVVPLLSSAAMSGNTSVSKTKTSPGAGQPDPGLRTDHLVTNEGLATLVEQFSTFMATRPTYMKESYNQDFKEAMKQCSTKIASALEQMERDLAGHLTKILNKDDRKLPLAETLKLVTRPMIRSLFVGYLSLDAVVYVWDQYVLGLDAPHYDIIPPITTLLLIFLKRFLIGCSNAGEVAHVLKTESPKLKKEQFMHGIQKHFHKELYSSLVRDGGLPVLDPTQMPVPWKEWHREELPPVIRPADREMSRQRRLQERLREKEREEEEERERQEREEARRQQERDRWQRQLDDAAATATAREEQLLRLLEEEKKKRAEAAQRANDQVEQLARQIEQLKKVQEARPGPSAGPSAEPIPPQRVGQDLLQGVMNAVQTLSGTQGQGQ